MTAAHARRGKDTEQVVAKWLRSNGFPHCERTVRTGYRTNGRLLPDAADLNLCPAVIAQVKALRPPNRMERAVPGWLAETEDQRLAAGADVALLIVRRDGTTNCGDWFAWLPLVTLEWLRNDDDRPCDPNSWTVADVTPVRLLLADAVQMLRAAGYGTELNTIREDDEEEAS